MINSEQHPELFLTGLEALTELFETPLRTKSLRTSSNVRKLSSSPKLTLHQFNV